MVLSTAASTVLEYRAAGTNTVERQRALGHGAAGFATIGLAAGVGTALGFIAKTTLEGAVIGGVGTAPAGGVGALPGAVVGFVVGVGVTVASFFAFSGIQEKLTETVDNRINAKYGIKSASELRVQQAEERVRAATTQRTAPLGTPIPERMLSAHQQHVDNAQPKHTGGWFEDALETTDEFIQGLINPEKNPEPNGKVTVTVDTKANSSVKTGAKDIPSGTTKDHSQRSTAKVEVDASGKKVIVHHEHTGKKGRQDTVDRDYHRQGRKGSNDIPNAGRRRAN